MLASTEAVQTPSPLWFFPFVAILLCIALLPLIRRTHHWWERNSSKLLTAVILSLVTLGYYYLRGFGIEHEGHATERGIDTAVTALKHALHEYIPFIVLLFSLYTISGGINLSGDIPAHPRTNTAFLAVGAIAASFVGTTGASMVLIRPLLQINSERHRVTHTVIFFIFLVSNIGGCLLPIGDPPLFLGYLMGVPFLWTFHLFVEWAFMSAILLVVYYAWDSIAYRKETVKDISADEAIRRPLRLRGYINLLWLVGVVVCVGTLDPGKPFPGTQWHPPHFLREGLQLALVGLSLLTTPRGVREANKFNYVAIGEVACLFIGIFITMQVPIEWLRIMGPTLPITQPWHYFWATGTLSSFLDNAPTYVVFFELAHSQSSQIANPSPELFLTLLDGKPIAKNLLVAVSLGAVFMGANTYIGNGPNFMVKAIAEQSGVRMPSFFGYMLYSLLILIPLFLIVTFLFVG